MTPPAKAKELYDQFYNAISFDFPISWHEEAKRCALIALEEILNNKKLLLIGSRGYWIDVKTEIEKL